MGVIGFRMSDVRFRKYDLVMFDFGMSGLGLDVKKRII
jgi:hypothetical protein